MHRHSPHSRRDVRIPRFAGCSRVPKVRTGTGEPLRPSPNTRAPAHPRTRAPAHPRTRAPAHPRTRAPAHPRTRAPAHPRTRAPAHPRTRAPAHPRTRAPAHPYTHLDDTHDTLTEPHASSYDPFR